MMEEPIDPYGGQPYPYPPYPGYPPHPGYPPYAGYSPHPPYPVYPAYPVQSTPRRPGTVVAAAVLGFVNAGLLAIAALVLLATAASSSNEYLPFSPSIATELSIDAVVNLTAGTLFTLGGVMLLGGRTIGQPLIAISTVIVCGSLVYWAIRAEGVFSAILGFGALFVALAVIAVSLAYATSARAWLART